MHCSGWRVHDWPPCGSGAISAWTPGQARGDTVGELGINGQNGFTITMMTMMIAMTKGISLMAR